MKSFLARLIVSSILLLLAACNFSLPPVSSAVVEQSSSGKQIPKVELTQSQINAFSGWFAQHSSGWSSSVVSYVPTLVVRAKHSNGEASVVNVLGNSVVVYNNAGQFIQQFSEPEIGNWGRSELVNQMSLTPLVRRRKSPWGTRGGGGVAF